MSGARSLTTRSERPFAQFEPAHDVVRHDLHDDAAVARQAVEVVPKRPHFEPVVDSVADELVRARCRRGDLASSRPAPGGHDLDHQIDRKRAGRLPSARSRRCTRSIGDDRVEIAKRAATRRGEVRIENAREREDDVCGCQLVAVMEADALRAA